ncbi:hypothetical protein ACTQWG_09415 [Blautia sp. HCP3S3_H10_1]|uniref:hypothetical protein n=1 Tax=unclassified Blautia TaxID=2648079 RepID=UPI003F8F0602|nr:ABC transporter permease [Clostridia bacterium]
MKNYISKYVKVTVTVLLSAAFFYFGMKDYVNVGKNNIAVAELYGTYPAVSQAEELFEEYQNGDEITDICFVWNGGVQEIKNLRYSRPTNANVTGVVGLAALYDRQAAVLDGNDEKGCVIDRTTALELFGSEDCVGNQVAVGENIYEVRGVASWNQQILLIRPSQKNRICTQVLIRSKKGQSLESAASSFLMGNGLSGTLVDDSWLDMILPWFPVAFLVMLTITVSKWEHMFIISALKLEYRLSGFILRILPWGICFFLSIFQKAWHRWKGW